VPVIQLLSPHDGAGKCERALPPLLLLLRACVPSMKEQERSQ